MQLIVLGMHRSGTSALARLLTVMGAYFGPESISTGANVENPKGFWERRDLRDANDALMSSRESCWDQICNFSINDISAEAFTEYQTQLTNILDELNSHRPWMIKEPRLCLLAPLLEPLLDKPIYIHIYRNPLEVAKSLRLRNHIPIAAGLALWERYNIEAFSATRNRPRILVCYNDLISNPATATQCLYNQLIELGVEGISIPDDNNETELIDTNLYRQKANDRELTKILNQEQITLYQSLLDSSILNKDSCFNLSISASLALEDHQMERQRAIDNEVSVERLTKTQGQLERKIERDQLRLNDIRKDYQRQIKDYQRQIDENKISLKAKQSQVNAKEREISKLSDMTEQLFTDIKALLLSNRWKLGDGVLSLPYTLTNRKKPELASENIARTYSRFQLWQEQHQVILEAQKNNSPEEAPLPYKPLDEKILKQRIHQYQQSTTPKTIAIYTSITGSYDELKTPEELSPNCDYICFTDRPLPSHPVWQFRPTLYFNVDQTRIARYYKLHPHLYLHDYDLSIWVDANILIRKHMGPLIKTFESGNQPLGIFKHYSRECTYEEAIECIDAEKDDPEVILSQIDKYRQDGFPVNFGLPETNIVISQPNNPSAAAVFNSWWESLDSGSKRDQLSIMYALWKNKVSYTPLVDGKSKMARFDRESFELFNHQRKRTYSHPSIYKQPSFLPSTTDSNLPSFWEESTENIAVKQAAPQAAHIDIVIPVHNALTDVKNCLLSVLPTLEDSHRIIIVDDGSDTETQLYLENVQQQYPSKVLLTRNNDAQRYTKAANKGMKLAGADYVILLNSDTIVSANWSEKMVNCARSGTNIGIVGPLSNAASWQSIPVIKDANGSYSNNPLPKNITIDNINQWCERSSMRQFPRVQLVNGFCLLITRQLIDAIGYFDEESYPKGYNEENDYCFRCSDKGFELAVASDTYVYHAKSKSYTPKTRLQLCEESRIVFEARYGLDRINRATESVRLNPLINRVRKAVALEWKNVLA